MTCETNGCKFYAIIKNHLFTGCWSCIYGHQVGTDHNWCERKCSDNFIPVKVLHEIEAQFFELHTYNGVVFGALKLLTLILPQESINEYAIQSQNYVL